MKEIVPVEFCQETLKLKKNIESGFLALAERLDRIKREKLWEGEWGSWAEFLMEMKLSEATASKLINVYKTFVLEYKIDSELLSAAGWSGLYEIIPLCDSPKKAKELVGKVSMLKRDDMRDEIREAKKGVCKHEHEKKVILHVCEDCGKSRREFDE